MQNKASFFEKTQNNFMDNHAISASLLLIGIPLEWQSEIEVFLKDKQFTTLFSASKDEATKIIQSRKLGAVIITSDLVFDDNISQDVIVLTYGKIPTLTLILDETFKKLGQAKVFDKVYNPEAFQEFCTIPFDVDEMILRLQKIIQKAKNSL